MIRLRSYLENRIKRYNEIFMKYSEEIIKWKWPNPIYLLDKDWNYIMNWIWICKIEEDGIHSKLMGKFNLSDPIERQLSRINGFYEVLSRVEDDRLKMLFESVYYDRGDFEEGKLTTQEFVWWGMEDMWDFQIYYDEDWYYNSEKWKPCIKVSYSEYQYGEHIQWLERWDEDDRYECYTPEEFNLLMQIYWWVYDDEKLRRELEEKERRWEYEKIKRYLNNEKMYKMFERKEEKIPEEDRKLLEEYLKLELMRKPTDWAFPELKIKKIYDKAWSEEEQRRVVEEINKELGKEIVVLD